MKILFQFENGTSLIVLTPENARDKAYLSLCSDGKNDIRIKPTTNESLVIELSEQVAKKSHALKLGERFEPPLDSIGE